MNGWQNYHSPTSVEQALDLLSRYQGQARVVAGGTDLLLELRQGHRPPVEALVDITCIPELNGMTFSDGGEVTLGAAITHTQVVSSEKLAASATCLVESCGVVGGPQVRNVGTLGGNVAHALPAGDGTTSLVVLDAEAEIVQDGERRWLPLLDLYVGPGFSLLEPTRDLLLRFRFPLAGPGEGSAFKRIMRPQGVALPILGCGVWIRVTPNALIDEARVNVAPVGPTPRRLDAVEAMLVGKSVADDESLGQLVDDAAATVREVISPRTSKYRATAEYRLEMADVLLKRTLPLAIHRARSGEAVPEGVGLE